MPTIHPQREDAHAYVKAGLKPDYGTIPEDAWMIILLPSTAPEDVPEVIDFKTSNGRHVKYCLDAGLTERIRMYFTPRERFNEE